MPGPERLQNPSTDHQRSIYRLRPRAVLLRTLLLAVIARRWTPARFSQTPLLPDATAMISLATRSLRLTSVRFSLPSMIHLMAVRRRCLMRNGTGIGSDCPPPSTPRCWRILTRGATESTTEVRYWMGDMERLARGTAGAVVWVVLIEASERRGRALFMAGGGAVRRLLRMWSMFWSKLVRENMRRWRARFDEPFARGRVCHLA